MPPGQPDTRQPALQTRVSAPPAISRAPGTTVHAQIEDWLAGEITVGRLVPGDRLPAEQDLAAWFGVSRMTLRHALGELARRGLVTKAVGRRGGTFVAAAKLEQDLTTLAGFSEQLRRAGMVAGARVLSAMTRPAGPPPLRPSSSPTATRSSRCGGSGSPTESRLPSRTPGSPQRCFPDCLTSALTAHCMSCSR